GILNVFKMLSRQIGTDHLRSHVGGRQIDVHTVPAVCPFRIGEKTVQYLGVQLILAAEVAVEPSVGQPRSRHDLVDGNFLESVTIEEPASTVDNLLLRSLAMTLWIGHGDSFWMPGAVLGKSLGIHDSLHYLQNIILNILWPHD